MKDFFPSKLALGDQFCNRTEEKTRLKANILSCRHTVLNAPRRHGKSSLVINVIRELKLPAAVVDLFLAHDDQTVARRVLRGVEQALSLVMPPSQKVLATLQKSFSRCRVSLGAYGFHLDIVGPAQAQDHIDQILDGLQALSRLAQEHGKRVIFFIDEFQDITQATGAKSIQGAIRHVAQETSSITFIFSGSNRQLLTELFDDKSKPLYMLCDRLSLHRIAATEYHDHLNGLAQQRWKAALPEETFHLLMTLTEAHPYYVNLLCHELWQLKVPPTPNDAQLAWHRCYETHRDKLISDVERLSGRQKDVLKALAAHPTTMPTGVEFVKHTGISSASIAQAVKVLINLDLVYQVRDEKVPGLQAGELRVLDPLLTYMLHLYL